MLDGIYLRTGNLSDSFPGLAEEMIRATLSHLKLPAGFLWVQDFGALMARREEHQIVVYWEESWEQHGPIDPTLPEGLQGAPGDSIPFADAVGAPIPQGGGIIGEIWLSWPMDIDGRAEAPALLADLARQCGYLVRRFEARRWMTERFGRPLMLIGLSPEIRELDLFLERAADSELPVLLSGEFGTEKSLLAASIHALGPRRDRPFVQIHCTEPKGTPADWFTQADEGTLLLCDIDELPLDLQKQLPHRLRSGLDQCFDQHSLPRPRVIATTTADLPQRVREGSFSRALLAELDFLAATLPPLRRRCGDIQALLAAALRRQGARPEERLNEEFVNLCRAYDWPGNLYELEQVVARLTVMGEQTVISRGDVLRHAPWIVPDQPEPEPEPEPPPPSGNGSGDMPNGGPDHWTVCTIRGDAEALNQLHPGLRRALLHLGRNYTESLSMEQLARQAHVSPSHLSFLFRNELDTSFKSLMGRIRIHQAKEVLSSQTRQPITDVALQLGFADLSHFEKSFRKIVGQSPREFRRDAVDRADN